MNKKFIDLAPNFFLNGYSCSESIAMSAFELGFVEKDFVSIATSFSGGMSSGCLCGAIAGSQMVLGALFGRFKDNSARQKAKEFYQKFTQIHKVTCCKVLTKNFSDFHSQERKNHCVNMVADCAKILDEMLSDINIKETANL